MPRLLPALLLAAVLSGCGGLPREPLLGNLESEQALGRFTLLTFDETNLTGSPFSRDGTTRAGAAIDAASTGMKGLNAVGGSLDSFSEGSSALSKLDSFVFVPTRSHRAVTTELVDEQDGELRIQGTIQGDPDDADAPFALDLRLTGPGTNLRLQSYFDPPASLYTQVQGTTTDDQGRPVSLRLLDITQLGLANDRAEGRQQVEVYRANGSLLYAADTRHGGPLDGEDDQLAGRDLWLEPDGYWVASEFDLHAGAGGQMLGVVSFTASDGSSMALVMESGSLSGEVRDTDGALVASMALDEQGNLMLLDPAGGPLLDDQGRPISLDVELL
ncbi:MAG: hypothetical protein HUU35_07505 [Armatimonadetes bacterium]|nr:hypothetical protein [Armatimonadota bacterium]